MEQKEVNKINKENRKLCTELAEELGIEVKYGYHYEKGGWISGYDGEPGFDQKDTRYLSVGITDFSRILELESNTWKDEFRQVTKGDVANAMVKRIEDYPSDKEALEPHINKIFSNRDNLLDALKKNEPSFNYAPEEAKQDREFMIDVLKVNPEATRHIGDNLINDKELFEVAVEKYGKALCHAGEQLQDDKDLVLKAVNQDAWATHYASERLQNDKDVAMASVRNYPGSLSWVGEEMKNDKEVVLEAYKKDNFTLQHASKEIQDLCKDKDPIKVLESCILAEKLQDQLSHKQNQAPTKKMKI